MAASRSFASPGRVLTCSSSSSASFFEANICPSFGRSRSFGCCCSSLSTTITCGSCFLATLRKIQWKNIASRGVVGCVRCTSMRRYITVAWLLFLDDSSHGHNHYFSRNSRSTGSVSGRQFHLYFRELVHISSSPFPEHA